MIQVRNYRLGEFLPAPLLDTGTPYIDPKWCWVVTPKETDLPFAIIVGSFAHGWFCLWRVLVVRPLPKLVSPHWFLEAMPKVLENARERGCVAMMTLFDDQRPQEVKLARIVLRMGGKLLPCRGSLAVVPLAGKD